MTLVDCLSEASFLKRRTFREARHVPRTEWPGALLFLSRRSLGEGGWFVLFAFGKLKSRAFHALFVFPFQGQGKTKPSRKRAGCLLALGEQRK
jgi:hypothetical protein